MVIKAERKKLNKKQVFQLVSKFKRTLENERIPFQQVIVFGSYASGQADRDSDLDLAVILPTTVSHVIRKKLPTVPWLAKQINVKLEPHLLSVNDYNNRYLSLVQEIKRAGRVF